MTPVFRPRFGMRLAVLLAGVLAGGGVTEAAYNPAPAMSPAGPRAAADDAPTDSEVYYTTLPQGRGAGAVVRRAPAASAPAPAQAAPAAVGRVQAPAARAAPPSFAQATPAPSPVPGSVRPRSALQPAPPPRPAGAPMVNLGEYRSLEAARAAWASAAAGSRGKVQRIELIGGQALTYRALIDGYSTAAEAEAACAAYRARGGRCSVR